MELDVGRACVSGSGFARLDLDLDLGRRGSEVGTLKEREREREQGGLPPIPNP